MSGGDGLRTPAVQAGRVAPKVAPHLGAEGGAS